MATILMINESQLDATLDIGFNKTFEEYSINKGAWDVIQTEVIKSSRKKMKK